MEAEPEALNYIARQADGALRDGLSLLEQCISFYFGEKLTFENALNVLGAVDHAVYHELMEALVENRVDDVIQVVANMIEQGKDLTQFVNEFIWYLRNMLVVKTADNGEQLVDMSAENKKELKQYAEIIELPVIFRYIRILSELANRMKYGNNKRIMLEVALIKLCRPRMEQDYDSLVQRLCAIEQTNEELQEALASGNLTVSAQQHAQAEEEAPVLRKDIRPEAVPDDVRAVVQNWKQILGRVSPVCRSMLADVRLSVSDDGKLMMAFGQEVTAEYFRSEEHQNELVEAAGQLTGKEISLDIRYVESRQEMSAFPELRNIIKNVEIEILD